MCGCSLSSHSFPIRGNLEILFRSIIHRKSIPEERSFLIECWSRQLTARGKGAR